MCATLRTERPWGFWEVLYEGKGFKVKRIVVAPGQRLSLQSHKQRSEHWVVVKGTATVTIEEKTFEVGAEDAVFVSAGQKHRLENKAKVELEIVEVQNGPYLEEDDIVRYEDDYGRK